MTELVVVGGAGFVGSAVAWRAAAAGTPVVVVDRAEPAPPPSPTASVRHHVLDLLTDLVALPPGRVMLAAGNSDPRAPQPWRLVLDNAITTARMLPALARRDVVLVSSVEVYGAASPLDETKAAVLPLPDGDLAEWCDRAVALARGPCPPWQAARLCRELADADPTGRWVYGMAKRAQEMMVRAVVDAERLTVFRVANIFGGGQDRVVAQLTRRALVGLPLSVTATTRTFLSVEDLVEAMLASGGPGTVDAGLAPLRLVELARLVLDELRLSRPVRVNPAPTDDTAGLFDTAEFRRRLGASTVEHPDDRLRSALRAFVRTVQQEMAPGSGGATGSRLPLARPAFTPPLSVVVPPRPRRPDVVADRMQGCLESGVVRAGRWTRALTAALRERLRLGDEYALLLTPSGTAALRLAVVAAAGAARPGDVAVLPSFTFIATAEALVQLGYRLRFCDVREDTWTLDADLVGDKLTPGDVRVVVSVDALGAPADYAGLAEVCAEHGVPLVADSAPALGACWQGRPVGTQAPVHAFSLSFAKVVSAAGGGGALVLPASSVDRLRRPVDWTRSAQLSEPAAVAALDLVEDLDTLVRRRRAVAAVYEDMASVASVRPQRTGCGDGHAWVHWVARFPAAVRGRLTAALLRDGIGTKPYYAPVLHAHDWAGHAEPADPLPVTDALAPEVLALPMSSEITPGQAERVACAVLSALACVPR